VLSILFYCLCTLVKFFVGCVHCILICNGRLGVLFVNSCPVRLMVSTAAADTDTDLL
jgi:hypothetical protein